MTCVAFRKIVCPFLVRWSSIWPRTLDTQLFPILMCINGSFKLIRISQTASETSNSSFGTQKKCIPSMSQCTSVRGNARRLLCSHFRRLPDEATSTLWDEASYHTSYLLQSPSLIMLLAFVKCHILALCALDLQGDPSRWWKPPVDLDLTCPAYCLGSRQIE